MSLWSRLRALENDVAQAKRDHRLLPRWEHELAQTRREIAAESSHVLPRKGIDYAWARPTVHEMRQIGATFACRYLTIGGKALTVGEARGLSAANIAIVSIFEEGATAMAGGGFAGRHDAVKALRAAEAVGMPKGRPIYFACDFDIQSGEMAQAIAYLKEARAVLAGHYYAGVYGGRRMILGAQAAGFHFLWQTLAWSGTPTQWVPQAQLRQTNVGKDYDYDQALAQDFGQWKHTV